MELYLLIGDSRSKNGVELKGLKTYRLTRIMVNIIIKIKNMELTIQDIRDFYGCSSPTARMRVNEIKKYLKLPQGKKRILLHHLAKYEGLEVQEVETVIRII